MVTSFRKQESNSSFLLQCHAQQIVGRERREGELIADFQLPIVDLIRAAASTQPFGGFHSFGKCRDV